MRKTLANTALWLALLLAQCNGGPATIQPPIADSLNDSGEILEEIGDLPQPSDQPPESDLEEAIAMDPVFTADLPAEANPPVFQTCESAPLPQDLSTGEWNHWYSSVIAAGDAGHSAQRGVGVRSSIDGLSRSASCLTLSGMQPPHPPCQSIEKLSIDALTPPRKSVEAGPWDTPRC